MNSIIDFPKYFLLLIAGCFLYFIYADVVQPANTGEMQPIQIDALSILMWFFWIMITAMLMPSNLKKPSDCFLLIYTVFSLMTGSLTWGSTGILSPGSAALLWLFLTVSAVLYKFFVWCGVSCINRYLYLPYIRNVSSYVAPVILLILLGVWAGLSSGQDGSFSMSESYSRRIIGRENFPDRALISYVFLMALNGSAPFAAFLATSSKKIWLLLCSIAFSVYAFWLIGVKEPVFLVSVMALLGYFLNSGIKGYLIKIFLITLTWIFLFALVEHSATGYSYVADYFIRRAFFVTGQVQTYYLDYMLNKMNFSEWWRGSESARAIGPGMLIGGIYFGNAQTNANTNTFLYAFLQYGFLGWIVALLCVSFLFSLLDCLNKIRSRHVAMAIGFLYALLLVEQNYATAFISSGIGVLCAIVMLFRFNFGEHRK